MSIKIEKINNAIVVTDTVTSKILVDVPARLVYFDTDVLEQTPSRIRLLNINDREDVHARMPTYLLSDCVDGVPAAFTKASWRTFARTNLG